MTAKQLESRLRYWKRKLGLHDWEFEIQITAHPNGKDGSDACVHTHNHYESAIIELLDEFEDWDKTKTDRVIVHELLHIRMRNLDTAISSVYDYLAPAPCNMHHERVEHETEGYVEWLARLIVELDAGTN